MRDIFFSITVACLAIMTCVVLLIIFVDVRTPAVETPPKPNRARSIYTVDGNVVVEFYNDNAEVCTFVRRPDRYGAAGLSCATSLQERVDLEHE